MKSMRKKGIVDVPGIGVGTRRKSSYFVTSSRNRLPM